MGSEKDDASETNVVIDRAVRYYSNTVTHLQPNIDIHCYILLYTILL